MNALLIRRDQLGDDHPDTLESMSNLAKAYQDAGRLDKAIPILELALAKRRDKLGEEHADTLESMNDLAVAYWEEGQLARAIPLYESTLLKFRAQAGRRPSRYADHHGQPGRGLRGRGPARAGDSASRGHVGQAAEHAGGQIIPPR